MTQPPTLSGLAAALDAGEATATGLADAALAAITRQKREGIPAFIAVDADAVMASAEASDARRKAGRAISRFDGIPFAVKDLFDIAGEATPAGSVLLKGTQPARADADAVALLRSKGMIVLGRTNMTEFAYSGLGLNPHHGTPTSVFDRATGRIPGGSSSGSAVAVADGVCALALGTDTGGSCRIPAAFNGITGFKPTAMRISRRGAFPLSGLFDSVGPLARSAECCAIADSLLSGGSGETAELPLSPPLRLGALSTYVLDDLDPAVSEAYSGALARLKAAGVEIEDFRFEALAEMPALLRNGGVVAYEAWHLHKDWIARSEAQYDPRVSARLRMGAETDSASYARLLARRGGLIAAFWQAAQRFDAILCPAVPIVPPPLTAFVSDENYRRLNGLCLRNTYLFNFLDGCAGVLPMQPEGALPSGLMLAGPAWSDRHILAVMARLQAALR
jgi:aspartyl-tRNA(Asn)/glutamyl-tRNA(Gln) amidotransferase subunit A